MPDVRVFASLADLSLAAADAVAEVITSAVRARGRCAIALSGGETPRPLYSALAARYRDQIPWHDVHVFWGDERLVPIDDPRRNDRMAREMLLSKVPCPSSNIHPMASATLPPDDLARRYEETMRTYFADGRPRFDLVLLGLGVEGHTASLFPGSPALDERTRWVVAVDAPANPARRLTLTLPVLTSAAHAAVLVSGASKAHALRLALDPRTDPTRCPAAAVRLADGALTWWVDADAADKGDDQDAHKGAVEQTSHDPIVPIEPFGANFDDSEVANANEVGQTSDAPRDEQL